MMAHNNRPDDILGATIEALAGETEEQKLARYELLIDRFIPEAERAQLRSMVRADYLTARGVIVLHPPKAPEDEEAAF